VTQPAFPRLYVVCDEDACAAAGWSLADYAGACLDGGATLLQVRAKRMSGQELLDVCSDIVRQAQSAGARVVVNDRPDIARMAAAAGVHVGQDDLSPAAARDIVGRDALVGVSTHTPSQYEAALGEPISYVAVGPIFRTSTKQAEHEPVGFDRLRAAARRARERGVPLVAIGGITLERAPAVIQAGAEAVAVISDLLATRDPRARVREFLLALA
jgi:thiamine-phosphate pyrophosphorylase